MAMSKTTTKSHRQLDLTLISAKDLKDVNIISKMDVYAFVSLSDDAAGNCQRTPTCTDCGRNPNWNFSMRFLIPNSVSGHKQTLRVQIRSQRALGDRDIGEVVIPIDELESDRGVKYAAYQVRNSSGKAKGILNISYKLGDSTSSSAAQAVGAFQKTSSSCGTGRPGEAYPPPPPPPSKVMEPVTAYPMSNAPYPPPPSVPYGNSYGYDMPQQQVHTGYPPVQPQPPLYGGYAPGPLPYGQQAYGGTSAGYGAAGAAYPAPGGYGYNGYAPPPPPPVQKPPKKNKLGLGLGLGAGLLGGLLVGDAIGDISSSGYEDGYDAGFDDGGGFDF
ncbi:hypothetical protein ZOSMA_48G00830 [Zostera marina]|uniref:C2 domain-containing protein n=1 Tax=Zostera marina TaxID=29655 RepID=A0A0K9P1R5_ZOSMR|nr:hypothetical protein ZOSMA_48G00830 [Zostera marina]